MSCLTANLVSIIYHVTRGCRGVRLHGTSATIAAARLLRRLIIERIDPSCCCSVAFLCLGTSVRPVRTQVGVGAFVVHTCRGFFFGSKFYPQKLPTYYFPAKFPAIISTFCILIYRTPHNSRPDQCAPRHPMRSILYTHHTPKYQVVYSPRALPVG